MFLTIKKNTEIEKSSFSIIHENVKTELNKNLINTLNNYLLNTHKDLARAIKYAVLGKGCRLRPLAMALSAKSLGMRMPIEVMQAIELMHSYSLVHDDLPALDNDKYRRGQLSVHAKFGEPIAILTGDALMAMSFDLVSESEGDAVNILSLSKALAIASGPKALVDGQTRDILPIEMEVENESDIMPLLKTGSLFSFATSAPCIYCGMKKDSERFMALEKFGSLFGLAYQYYDDLKDNDTKVKKLKNKINSILIEAIKCLLPWKKSSRGLINMCSLINLDC